MRCLRSVICAATIAMLPLALDATENRVIAPAFSDVTEKAGVAHRHHGPVVDERLRNLGPWFTALGAGGAVGDFNNDGYEDIYVTDSLSGHKNVLYRNNGDFTFTDVLY